MIFRLRWDQRNPAQISTNQRNSAQIQRKNCADTDSAILARIFTFALICADLRWFSAYLRWNSRSANFCAAKRWIALTPTLVQRNSARFSAIQRKGVIFSALICDEAVNFIFLLQCPYSAQICDENWGQITNFQRKFSAQIKTFQRKLKLLT